MHSTFGPAEKNEIKTKDEADILTEHLLVDSGLLEDFETERLLKHMEIDLNRLKELDPESIESETSKVIRSFFGMEEGDTMRIINRKNLITES